MFCKWIKPIDSKVISSFIAKTVMFWFCEEYCPQDVIWQKESCVCILTLLFRHLLIALEERRLPYYFISSIYVIEKVDDESRVKMISIGKEIECNTQKFIPRNVDEVIEVSTGILNLVMSVNHMQKQSPRCVL